jgi:hypothetical protein
MNIYIYINIFDIWLINESGLDILIHINSKWATRYIA